uniref:ADP-ribosyl cyclase/cyclic ADP-ribose hydrolase n=1 Tax=Fagus sylvatica TaxID=28930 RepID=A0A2N9EK43_FAGSY
MRNLSEEKTISLELLKAIEESKYAIVVLSSNYASSRWCLIELAKIVGCLKENRLTVLPVFHYVDPSDVRNQTGTLIEAFARHEKDPKINIQDVQEWKAALKEVGNISGWHLHDRPESIVIQEILGKIFSELNRKFSSASKDLVGIASRVEEMLHLYLGEGLGGVRFVGICGMGGSGNRLRNKKVLIVLDDVDGEKQLEALAGKHDWFGVGSRIIVTSRDSHLLRRHGVDDVFITEGLNDDESLELFSWRAFKKPHPEENYVDLSKDFVNYTNGLPLALKVLDYNLDVLVDKSLIFINEKGTLWMHDLLQDMGKEIVRRESPKEPGGRSRLWLYEDVLHVLKNNSGTEAVEGIMLNTPKKKEEHLSAEAFSKMKKLRLLKIGNVQLPQDLIRFNVQLPQDLIRFNVQLPQGLNYLSNELHIVEWHGYPLKSMPTNFQPNHLVELRMRCSRIKQLWKGMVILDELKFIDLSDSQYLIETPEFSGVPNLKHLILQRCTRLSKIHASLGNLKRLIRLDLNGCKRLESLPHKINLESLEVFTLTGCSRLKKFPEIVGNMSRLSKLYLNKTAIKPLPVEHLTSLLTLDLSHCNNLSSLPNAICSLTSLKTLALSGCSKLDELPENLGNIKGLEELYVSGTAITRLPSSVVLLKNLKVLSLCGCEGLSSESSNNLLSFPLMRRRLSRSHEHDHSNQHGHFHFLEFPGSEIPKWFSHRKVGASMNLQVPSDLFYKCMGIAVCVVHVLCQHHPLDQLPCRGFSGFYKITHVLWCSIKVNRVVLHKVRLGLSEEFGKIESHHLHLRYLSFSREECKEALSQSDANGFIQIEIIFEPEGPGLEVTKCGAHLVYKEDLNQTMGGCSITPYEDDVDDSANDNIIKQSRND